MQSYRRLFFQILLIVLALVFTLTIRYITAERCAQTGGFGGNNETYRSVTVSEVFYTISGESR